jgi:hypothetical protein
MVLNPAFRPPLKKEDKRRIWLIILFFTFALSAGFQPEFTPYRDTGLE